MEDVGERLNIENLTEEGKASLQFAYKKEILGMFRRKKTKKKKKPKKKKPKKPKKKKKKKVKKKKKKSKKKKKKKKKKPKKKRIRKAKPKVKGKAEPRVKPGEVVSRQSSVVSRQSSVEANEDTSVGNRQCLFVDARFLSFTHRLSVLQEVSDDDFCERTIAEVTDRIGIRVLVTDSCVLDPSLAVSLRHAFPLSST